MEPSYKFEGLSKSERKKLKREIYRVQKHKEETWTKFKNYAVVLGIVAGALAVGYFALKELSKPQPGQYVTSLGNRHLKDIKESHEPYNSLPPTSGPHLGDKAGWGIRGESIPDELQLHNLEDGGIMVQYNCSEDTNGCTKLVDQLTSVVRKYKDKVTMAPYPNLDTKIALTAWTRIDKFNEFDAERVERFIKAFKGVDHHQ